jgi:hypothetical protein
MNDTLFNMESVAMDSPRLVAIKKHDIQTHFAPGIDYPWLAIPMTAAKERLKYHITKDEPFDTVADITATYGSVLDDAGLLFYGVTQKQVEDDALVYVERLTCNTKPLQ